MNLKDIKGSSTTFRKDYTVNQITDKPTIGECVAHHIKQADMKDGDVVLVTVTVINS